MMASLAPPLTQEQGKSQVQYAWIILFHYNMDDPEPFSIVPLNFFAGSGSDFPWSAVKGVMHSEFRSEKRTFSKIPGKEFMIFAKVEIGE